MSPNEEIDEWWVHCRRKAVTKELEFNSTITLSSGEAELHGVVKGGANGLGFLSLLRDYNIRVKLRLWTDSSASKGMCSRQGLGKVRHLDVQDLWIQQRLRNVDFSLYKVKGDDNPGDLFTKASLTSHRIGTLLSMLNCNYRQGRAISAPALRKKEESKKTFKVERRPRWSDECDSDGDNFMGKDVGEEEALRMLRSMGFPHARKMEFKEETAKSAYPEVKEVEGDMCTYGEHIGRKQRGRGRLDFVHGGQGGAQKVGG